jgi:hypothetical protein
MIGYCPIEFEEPPSREVRKEPVIMDENTECNYVVMFFIVGVIALAAMDAVKK